MHSVSLGVGVIFSGLQGMGGQHHYFGLWLDSNFGCGHSRARPKCTTYGSPQLSGEEDFTIDSMEVWAVGKPPEPEEVRALVLVFFCLHLKQTKEAHKKLQLSYTAGSQRSRILINSQELDGHFHALLCGVRSDHTSLSFSSVET